MKTLNIEIPEGYEIDQEKSTFKTIVFKKKSETLPKTFEELNLIEGAFVTTYSEVELVSHVNADFSNYNLFATEKQARASIALAQLSQLREVYRNGWEPDWTDYSDKACIDFYEDGIKIIWYSVTPTFLSFQSWEIVEKFLENFKDLIEQAKPLMS
jgi:hypothetical protein